MVTVRGERGQVHQALPGLLVAPEHVAVAVAVEIAEGLCLPRRGDQCRAVAHAARRVVRKLVGKLPELIQAEGVVAPQQIGHAIAVEVAHRKFADEGLAAVQELEAGIRRGDKVTATIAVHVAQRERVGRPDVTGHAELQHRLDDVSEARQVIQGRAFHASASTTEDGHRVELVMRGHQFLLPLPSRSAASKAVGLSYSGRRSDRAR